MSAFKAAYIKLNNILTSQKSYSLVEKLVFICFLVFSLYNVWIMELYVTVDGPAHLYNSVLLNQLKTSDFLNSYYSANVWFLPNYLSNLILSKLLLIFDPVIAEKVFLSSIVILLPVSFRYTVNLLAGRKTFFSFLVFPLIFTQLFHFGFFNFSLAFIFLNCQVALTYLFCSKKSIPVIFLFVINSLFLFFTHGFIFAVTALISFLQVAIWHRSKIRELLKNLSYWFIMFLPSLTLFAFFMVKIKVSHFDYDVTTVQKWSSFINYTPGVVVAMEYEMQYSSVISILTVFLAASVITMRLNSTGNKIQRDDLFILLAICLIGLVFLAADGMYSGMFVYRLVYLVFYLAIFWLCCSLKNSKFMVILSFLVVAYSFTNLSFVRNKMLEETGRHAKEVIDGDIFIKDNSVVYTFNFTGSWYMSHITNYLALRKNIVLTENYEAAVGWFPLKWKEKIQNIQLEKDTVANKFVLPDYVFICGTQLSIDAPENSKVKAFLEKETVKCYESKYNFCHLYKVKARNNIANNFNALKNK